MRSRMNAYGANRTLAKGLGAADFAITLCDRKSAARDAERAAVQSRPFLVRDIAGSSTAW